MAHVNVLCYLIVGVKVCEANEKINELNTWLVTAIRACQPDLAPDKVPARKQSLWPIKLIFKCVQTNPPLINLHLRNANCRRCDIDELPNVNCQLK